MRRVLKREETGPSGENPRIRLRSTETQPTGNDRRGGKRDLQRLPGNIYPSYHCKGKYMRLIGFTSNGS